MDTKLLGAAWKIGSDPMRNSYNCGEVMGRSFCLEQEEGLYRGGIAMVDGMFGLLILASKVFLRIWSYLRSFLSHTGAATYQEDWGDICKVQEVVLETDELGKPREGFGGAFYSA